VTAVAQVALDEAGRLPGGGAGLLVLDGSADGVLATPAGVEAGPIATVRPGAGILGAVADGEAEIVNDVAADPRATDAERAVAASLIAAPLRVRGTRIGVVGAATSVAHDYRAADLKVLSAIAALAGPAIDQARAHEAAVRIRAT
jgi:GAF domain-containing protein